MAKTIIQSTTPVLSSGTCNFRAALRITTKGFPAQCTAFAVPPGCPPERTLSRQQTDEHPEKAGSWDSCQTTHWACDPKRQQKGHWCQKFPQATWPTETRWTPTNPILLRLWALPLHHFPSQSGLTATAAVAAHSTSHLWRSSCSLMIPDLAVTLSRQIWNRRIKGEKKNKKNTSQSISLACKSTSLKSCAKHPLDGNGSHLLKQKVDLYLLEQTGASMLCSRVGLRKWQMNKIGAGSKRDGCRRNKHRKLKIQDLSLKTKQCFVTALDLTWKWTYKEVTTATGFQSRERMSCLNKAADEKPESFKGWGSTNTRKGKHNDGKTQGLGPADWWDSLQSEFRVRFFSPEHSIKPLCDSGGDLQSLLLQKPL